jgi:Uma2 family endonuclease
VRTATLLTAEDFQRVAQVMGPCELVKGEVVRVSPGGIRHSRVTGNAFRLLDAYCRARKLGRVLTGEAGVIVARKPDTVRGADVAFISFERLAPDAPEEGFLAVAPELVVEVLGRDTSWEKMDQKVADYHGAGVDLAWVLDPQTLTLRVYPRGAEPRVLHETRVVSADPHIRGFSANVADFFEA